MPKPALKLGARNLFGGCKALNRFAGYSVADNDRQSVGCIVVLADIFRGIKTRGGCRRNMLALFPQAAPCIFLHGSSCDK